jgi:lipoprotein-anchoring transpeptidase ErfK/SrfK
VRRTELSERVISQVQTAGVLCVCAAVLAGCGGGASHGVAGAEKTIVRGCRAGVEQPVGSQKTAWAGVVTRPTTAFASPGRRPIARFGLRNANGAPTVFGVLGERVDAYCRARWLHVLLPLRPNGSAGWVRAADIARAAVHTRITVDLSARRVRLYRSGRLVLSARAAVGSRATPTPLGRYYVNQRLRPSDPNGPFGPGAVGISAFSPVLTGWAQGGPIAIHGTNEPWSIGRAVSNGCVRLRNAVLRRVFRLALAGTPVLIRA